MVSACEWSGCGQHFPTASDLYDHLPVHESSAQCQWTGCGHQLDRKAKTHNLLPHLRYSHCTFRPHRCSQCAKCFHCPKLKQRHERNVHERKSLLCVCPRNDCPFSSVKVVDLQEHCFAHGLVDCLGFAKHITGTHLEQILPNHKNPRSWLKDNMAELIQNEARLLCKKPLSSEELNRQVEVVCHFLDRPRDESSTMPGSSCMRKLLETDVSSSNRNAFSDLFESNRCDVVLSDLAAASLTHSADVADSQSTSRKVITGSKETEPSELDTDRKRNEKKEKKVAEKDKKRRYYWGKKQRMDKKQNAFSQMKMLEDQKQRIEKELERLRRNSGDQEGRPRLEKEKHAVKWRKIKEAQDKQKSAREREQEELREKERRTRMAAEIVVREAEKKKVERERARMVRDLVEKQKKEKEMRERKERLVREAEKRRAREDEEKRVREEADRLARETEQRRVKELNEKRIREAEERRVNEENEKRIREAKERRTAEECAKRAREAKEREMQRKAQQHQQGLSVDEIRRVKTERTTQQHVQNKIPAEPEPTETQRIRQIKREMLSNTFEEENVVEEGMVEPGWEQTGVMGQLEVPACLSSSAVETRERKRSGAQARPPTQEELLAQHRPKIVKVEPHCLLESPMEEGELREAVQKTYPVMLDTGHFNPIHIPVDPLTKKRPFLPIDKAPMDEAARLRRAASQHERRSRSRERRRHSPRRVSPQRMRRRRTLSSSSSFSSASSSSATLSSSSSSSSSNHRRPRRRHRRTSEGRHRRRSMSSDRSPIPYKSSRRRSPSYAELASPPRRRRTPPSPEPSLGRRSPQRPVLVREVESGKAVWNQINVEMDPRRRIENAQKRATELSANLIPAKQPKPHELTPPPPPPLEPPPPPLEPADRQVDYLANVENQWNNFQRTGNIYGIVARPETPQPKFLLINNLPRQVTQSEVSRCMNDFGPCKVIVNNAPNSKVAAICWFKSPSQIEMVLARNNSKPFYGRNVEFRQSSDDCFKDCKLACAPLDPSIGNSFQYLTNNGHD